jgi:hypothetical protein
MERNCEFIRAKEGIRIKSVDCKVLGTMIIDLMRRKTMMKIVDENFIFIRRAINIRSSRKH